MIYCAVYSCWSSHGNTLNIEQVLLAHCLHGTFLMLPSCRWGSFLFFFFTFSWDYIYSLQFSECYTMEVPQNATVAYSGAILFWDNLSYDPQFRKRALEYSRGYRNNPLLKTVASACSTYTYCLRRKCSYAYMSQCQTTNYPFQLTLSSDFVLSWNTNGLPAHKLC